MPQRSGELSLRHLPDVSDASFSFQIPGNVHVDNLLAEEDLDFFGGADVSAAAPLISPAKTANRPVTRSQLTPKPALKLQPSRTSKASSSYPTSAYHDSDDTSARHEKPSRLIEPTEINKSHSTRSSKPRPKLITPSIPHLPSSEGSTANNNVPIPSVRADVNSLNKDLNVCPSLIDQDLGRMDGESPKGIRETGLEKKLSVSRAERREKRISRAKQKKLIEGGISKTRATTKLADIPSRADDAISVPQSSRNFPSSLYPTLSEDLKEDDSMAESGTGEGVAERLVQYSQKLINSFGLFSSDIPLGANDHPVKRESHVAATEAGTDSNIAQQETTADSDSPLTLSQISSRKYVSLVPDSAPTPPAKPPMSPLRSSSKRPVSDASDNPQRKKSKPDTASEVVPTTRPSGLVPSAKPRLRATRQHPKSTGGSRSVSSSSSKPAERDSTKAKVRRPVVPRELPPPAPAVHLKERKIIQDRPRAYNAIASSSSSTNEAGLSQSLQCATSRPASFLSLKKKIPASSSNTSGKPPFYISLNATTPVEFQSHTDSRLEARRRGHAEESAESQSQREAKYRIPIPDFKALHAAQEAKLARLKENIHPTVPQPIEWETNLRAKERQKFDEMVKEKEREHERLMEEQRKEREEQEDLELRELRKKAIPKAHEVPAWYKEAPRKKDKQLGAISR